MHKMRKNIVAALMVLSIVGCAQEELVITDSGLEYQYARKGDGLLPSNGDFLTMHIAYYDENDNKIFSSTDAGELMPLSFIDSIFVANGSLEECFSFIGEGDSIIAYIPAQTLFEKSFRRPLPDTLAADSKIKIYIGVHDVLNPDEFQAYQEERMQAAQAKQLAASKEQLDTDLAIIDEYLESEGIEAETTEEGLRYVVLEEGTGDIPQVGQRVRVDYTGNVLNGAMFDSSIEVDAKAGGVYTEGRTYEPYEFPLGRREVIAGWDIGIGKLKEGSKARLYIPSTLAYGPRQRSAVITANAILVFDVQLVEIVD